MQRHPEIGARILEPVPYFADLVPLVRSSHERYDGDGYPDGLAGEPIPLGSRVIAVCDAFHAMTEDRVYREAMALPSADRRDRALLRHPVRPAVRGRPDGGATRRPARPSRCATA